MSKRKLCVVLCRPKHRFFLLFSFENILWWKMFISRSLSIVSRLMADLTMGSCTENCEIFEGPWYHGNSLIEVLHDANWARSLADRWSTSGFVMFLGGNLISWKNKRGNCCLFELVLQSVALWPIQRFICCDALNKNKLSYRLSYSVVV